MDIPRTDSREDWAVYADWLTMQGDARGPVITEVLHRTKQNVTAVWMGACIQAADHRIREAIPSPAGSLYPSLSEALAWRRRRAKRARRSPSLRRLTDLRVYLWDRATSDATVPSAHFAADGSLECWTAEDLRIPF